MAPYYEGNDDGEGACVACGAGPLVQLGDLGKLNWVRCQACGMDQVAQKDGDEDGGIGKPDL